MYMNERIKKIRKTLNLSQEEFGAKIGLTRSSISKFEKGKINMSEQSLKLMCIEFNLNPVWLIEGTGEIFLRDDDIDRLAGKHNLDEFWIKILKGIIEMSDFERNLWEERLKSLVNTK